MKSAPVEWDFDFRPPSKRRPRHQPRPAADDDESSLHLHVAIQRRSPADRLASARTMIDRAADAYVRWLFLILRFLGGAVLGLVILACIWVASVIIRG